MVSHGLVALSFICTLPGFVLGTVSLQVIGGSNTVCPGNQVVLYCTTSVNDTTTTALRWNINDTSVELEKTYVPGDSLNTATTISNYQFTLISVNPMATTLRIANIQANTYVRCTQFFSNMAPTSSVNTTIKLAVAPQIVVTPSSCGYNSVTLQWNASLFDGGSNLTLTSSPPASNCYGSCSLDLAARKYSFSGLQPGVPYTLGVSGSNCRGTQQGIQSTFNVTIPSSQAPLVCPIYDAATTELLQISSTWYPLRISNSLLCGPVSTYNVTYAGPNGTDVYSIPAANCSSNCSHLYTVGAKTSSSQYSVSVAGFGVLTTMNTIVSTNNILKVDVVNWTRSAAITCTFLSGLVGTSGCVVSFGTSPDYLPYTLTSSQIGGRGQSVSVPLVINGAPLDLSGTVYHYRVALMSSSSQCASVLGQTGCPLGALVPGGVVSPDRCTTSCSNGTRGVPIPNSCVCVTGVATGAQATYVCDAGYVLEGGGGAQLCTPNGAWSGASTPTCVKDTGSSSSAPNTNADPSTTTAVIVGVVVCGCGLIVALVLGVGVSMLLYRRHLSDKGQQDSATGTKRIAPHTLPVQSSKATITSGSSIQPTGINYAEVVTVRVPSDGAMIVKTPSQVDVTYSTLKESEIGRGNRCALDV